jgi:uncharacterized protein DUF1206
MSASAAAESAVRQVAPWVERLARIGYAAKGVLYLTVGLLAAQAAVGRAARAVDTQGALRVVHNVSFGRVALVVIALGLIGYAVWRMVEAILDPEGHGTALKGLALRLSFAIRGLAHGALGLTALKLALRTHAGSRSDQTRNWTAWAFELPAGELLVWAGALGVAGYGVYQLYRAYVAKLSRRLDLSELETSTLSWVIGVSRFGMAARGVVFCLIGYLLTRAAAQHNAAEAGGVRKSLGLLANLGRWPFVVVALGLSAYGVYELLNARYRRIQVA